MNNIIAFLDLLPFNGYKSVIGGVAAIMYGAGGLFLGHLDTDTAMGFILAGWTALGMAHKGIKQAETTKEPSPQ